MPAPTDPKRLQVINRVVAVLQAITAGASYFYTPYAVVKRFFHWKEVTGFPVYMVFSDSGGSIVLAGAPDLYDEDFYINIKGYVQDNNDTVTVLERAIRDVQYAINQDSKSGVAGTLGTLAIETRMEESPETDNGYLSLEGFGFFDMRIRVKISGDYGEI